ncbi:MAG: bifunctional diguanylate cyclase/phosphodiesterase [Rhodospirillaceae bacterium]
MIVKADVSEYESVRAALNGVDVGVVQITPEGTICFTNSALQENFPELQALAEGATAESFWESLRTRESTQQGEGADHLFGVVTDNAVITANRRSLEDGGQIITITAAQQTNGQTEFLASQAELLFNALHDHLTGFANRPLFLDHLRKAIDAQAADAGKQFAVIHLDIDRFRMINESLGHVKGDDLINAVGQRLNDCLDQDDVLARFGGDEFTLLLSQTTGIDTTRALVDRLLASLTTPFNLQDREIFISASAGIAQFSEASDMRPEDLIRDAELAMYEAKKSNNGSVQVFDLKMRRTRVSPLDLETDLRRALERDQMRLHYQPIISLETRRLCGFEALLRWDRGERGLMSPIDFVPVAEEIGLIGELGNWVLLTACEQMREWHSQQGSASELELSVNLSSRQFNQADLVDQIMTALGSLDPAKLKLEITESALMDRADRTTAMLKTLKYNNIRVCIDDFGTGYSSLSYLHTFPIDTLKIDKSFIKDMTRNRQDLEIIRTITLLARNLRLDVTAEGVETPEQLSQLQALGCHSAQGFMFAPPLTVDDAAALINADLEW